jgi:hypothetical protein
MDINIIHQDGAHIIHTYSYLGKTRYLLICTAFIPVV